MDFETLTHRFKLFFNLFGLVQFRAHFKVAPTWKRQIADNLLAIFFLLALIVLLYVSLQMRYAFSNFVQTIKTVIAYSHISTEILLQFPIVVQALFLRTKLTKLWSAYAYIQKYMRIQMAHRIKFNKFQKRIFHVVILVFVPYV